MFVDIISRYYRRESSWKLFRHNSVDIRLFYLSTSTGVGFSGHCPACVCSCSSAWVNRFAWVAGCDASIRKSISTPCPPPSKYLARPSLFTSVLTGNLFTGCLVDKYVDNHALCLKPYAHETVYHQNADYLSKPISQTRPHSITEEDMKINTARPLERSRFVTRCHLPYVIERV